MTDVVPPENHLLGKTTGGVMEEDRGCRDLDRHARTVSYCIWFAIKFDYFCIFFAFIPIPRGFRPPDPDFSQKPTVRG
jgi:hypothetical protein